MAPDSIHVTDADDGTSVVRFAGEFDASNSSMVTTELEAICGQSVVVDLSEVTFGSSSFVNALLGLQRNVHAAGGTWTLGEVSPVIRRLIELTGLHDTLATRHAA